MIAKGRTTIRAEIDFGYSTYTQFIKENKSIISAYMKNIDKEIESITNDLTIDFEEKISLSDPYEKTNLDKEEAYALFNKFMFCSVYGFWETSLCGILKYYGITPKDYPSDMLKQISFPKNPDTDLLTTPIRELRNYFTHDSLSPKRKNAIQVCIEQYGTLGLLECNDSYCISSTDFVQTILKLVYKTLCNIELFCNKTFKNKIQ